MFNIETRLEQTLIKYLFWAFVLTAGDPDLIDVLIRFIQAWSSP